MRTAAATLSIPRLDASVRGYPWLVLAAVCLATFSSVIIQTSVNAAYPALAEIFSASIADIGWIGISFSLTSVTLMAAAGRLADLLGRRRMFLGGVAVSLIGSLLCGLAPSLGWLIVARVISGVGSAMTVANLIAIVATVFPSGRRSTAIALIETTVAIGMIVGPIGGGILVEYVGWRWLFFANWPLGLAGLLFCAAVLPDSERQGSLARFDFPGAVTFGLALVLLLGGMTSAARLGLADPWVIAMLGASALLLALFVWIERRAGSPMIALSLFSNPVFSAANLAMICCYICFMSAMFLSPFYYQRVLGYSPAQIGMAFLPIPIGFSLSSLIAGPLADRLGTRVIAPAGLLLASVGCLLLARVDPADGYEGIFVAIVVLLLGLGTFITPINSVIVGAAPPDKLSLASGFIALSRGLGMAAGLALAASLLQAGIPVHEAAGLPPTEAFVAAFQDVWKVTLIICLAGFAAALVQRRSAPRD